MRGGYPPLGTFSQAGQHGMLQQGHDPPFFELSIRDYPNNAEDQPKADNHDLGDRPVFGAIALRKNSSSPDCSPTGVPVGDK